MNKLKKVRIQMFISIGLFLVVCIIGVGLKVRAYVSENSPKTIMESVNIEVFNEAPETPVIEEELGAIVSPDITSRYLSVNNDVTYHITGNFEDASTTIMVIEDPFRRATSTDSEIPIVGTVGDALVQTGATSTVELVRLNITGTATSTYTITCGASATKGATSTTWNILSSDSIATSTFTGAVENNITSSYGTTIGGGSVSKIMIGAHQPYLICYIATDSDDQDRAFTDVGNTFDGEYMVRISKTRF